MSSKGYKNSPEYKTCKAIYINWRATAPKIIEKGWNLAKYIDAMQEYDAIKTTDSETYTQICEYFVSMDATNLSMVEKVKFNLNPSQIQRINMAATSAKIKQR